MDAPDGPRRTLLLVDADAALRTVARLHLGRAGYSILEASDEAGALAALGSARVDVAVCVVHQPRVDVEACLRRLRSAEDRAVRDVPVLLLCRTAAEGSLDALCAGLGPAAALDAPHTGPRLAAAVERLLARG